MSKYKGFFTYDIDNHRYIPIEQADGIISDKDYCPEPKGMKDVYVSCFCKNGVMIEFETEEEAEKAVEKLKAWHNLMDYWGTEILGWEIRDMPTGGNWQTRGCIKDALEVLDERITKLERRIK